MKLFHTLALSFALVFSMLFGAHTLYAQEVSTEDLLAQINELLAIVSSLQAQLAALSGGSFVSVPSFTLNLAVGDDNAEVRNLQILLNSNPATQVAVSGPGSPGNESTFFGNLTQDAVIKFQELHASEILAPVGLIRGSGFVGPSTRAKLNAVRASAVANTTPTPSPAPSFTPTPTPTPTTPIVSPTPTPVISPNITPTAATIPPSRPTSAASNTFGQLTIDTVLSNLDENGQFDPTLPNVGNTNLFYVSLPSEMEGSRGETITINGNLFSATGNSVHFNNTSVSNVASTNNGATLPVTVPSNAAYGLHEIEVRNNQGELADGTVRFVVKRPGIPSPSINLVTPAIGPVGSVVTIYGSGFTSNNRLEVGSDVYEGVVSTDGTSLSIIIDPQGLVLPPSDFELPEGVVREWPLYIHLINENGFTSAPGNFIIKD